MKAHINIELQTRDMVLYQQTVLLREGGQWFSSPLLPSATGSIISVTFVRGEEEIQAPAVCRYCRSELARPRTQPPPPHP